MTKINKLIQEIKLLGDCHVLEPTRLPFIDEKKHFLPEDLKEFYKLCGGLVLFRSKEYPVYVLPPEDLSSTKRKLKA